MHNAIGLISSLPLTTTDDFWRPGIGDPTFMGWLTVAAYFVAAFLCWRAAQTSSHHSRFWKGTAVAFAVLGVNKQLDLQSLLTAIGRSLAKTSGWYGDRFQVQLAFIILIAMVGCALIIWLCWHLRHAMREVGIALIGAIFVTTFVLIRAASFHHFDRFLDLNIIHFNMNWLLELSGIACVAIGASLQLKRRNRSERAASSHGATATQSPHITARSIHSQQQSRESFNWMVQRVKGESNQS